VNERTTIIPPSYPQLEAEAYRASEDEHERDTEPCPPPSSASPKVIWQTRSALRHATLVPLPWGLK